MNPGMVNPPPAACFPLWRAGGNVGENHPESKEAGFPR